MKLALVAAAIAVVPGLFTGPSASHITAIQKDGRVQPPAAHSQLQHNPQHKRAINGDIVFGQYVSSLDGFLIYTIHPDGSGLRQISPKPFECPTWSPDGRRLATCGNPDQGATAIIDPRTARFTELPMPDPTLFTACYLWTPNARRLACEGQDDSDPARNGVYSISAKGGQLRRVTTDPNREIFLGSYSPHGQRLVYKTDNTAENDGRLIVASSRGTYKRDITPSGSRVSSAGDWSPDGTKIIFSMHANPDARSSIWTIHPDGSHLRRVNIRDKSDCGGPAVDPSSVGCSNPHWSPDGRHIEFLRSSPTGNVLVTATADGTAVHHLTSTGNADFGDWGPKPSCSRT